MSKVQEGCLGNAQQVEPVLLEIGGVRASAGDRRCEPGAFGTGTVRASGIDPLRLKDKFAAAKAEAREPWPNSTKCTWPAICK